MKRAPNGEQTYYAGSFVYKGSNLEYILHSEGKYQVSDEDGGYQYNLTDHLGNVRMVVKGDETKKILDQTDYYPFGMSMNMALNASGQKNLYKYNGKEFQEDKIGNGELDWYDYGARMYDAALGRWHVVDPKAESYLNHSPYHFSGNNPIRFLDPNGKSYNDYKLNKDGAVELVEITDSETDELYATKDDGTIDKSKSVSVTKGTFDNSLRSKYNSKIRGFKTDNVADAKKVYKFAADNNQKTTISKGLEFGYIEFESNGIPQASVITEGSHKNIDVTKFAKELEVTKQATIEKISHNHPKSSGPSPGDVSAARTFPNNRTGQPIKRTVYIPQFNKVINYDQTGEIYDKNGSVYNADFFE